MRRRTIRVVVGLCSLIVVSALTGGTYQWLATRKDLAAIPPPGHLVDIRGYRLHLWCTGNGAPAVILDTGLGGSSADLGFVQAMLLNLRVSAPTTDFRRTRSLRGRTAAEAAVCSRAMPGPTRLTPETGCVLRRPGRSTSSRTVVTISRTALVTPSGASSGMPCPLLGTSAGTKAVGVGSWTPASGWRYSRRGLYVHRCRRTSSGHDRNQRPPRAL